MCWNVKDMVLHVCDVLYAEPMVFDRSRRNSSAGGRRCEPSIVRTFCVDPIVSSEVLVYKSCRCIIL